MGPLASGPHPPILLRGICRSHHRATMQRQIPVLPDPLLLGHCAVLGRGKQALCSSVSASGGHSCLPQALTLTLLPPAPGRTTSVWGNASIQILPAAPPQVFADICGLSIRLVTAQRRCSSCQKEDRNRNVCEMSCHSGLPNRSTAARGAQDDRQDCVIWQWWHSEQPPEPGAKSRHSSHAAEHTGQVTGFVSGGAGITSSGGRGGGEQTHG
jgi:hypothetical protein